VQRSAAGRVGEAKSMLSPVGAAHFDYQAESELGLFCHGVALRVRTIIWLIELISALTRSSLLDAAFGCFFSHSRHLSDDDVLRKNASF
jgi:hypothetical protein